MTGSSLPATSSAWPYVDSKWARSSAVAQAAPAAIPDTVRNAEVADWADVHMCAILRPRTATSPEASIPSLGCLRAPSSMAAGMAEASSWGPPANDMALDKFLQIPGAVWRRKFRGLSGMKATMTAEAAAARAKAGDAGSHPSSAACDAAAWAARLKAVSARPSGGQLGGPRGTAA